MTEALCSAVWPCVQASFSFERLMSVRTMQTKVHRKHRQIQVLLTIFSINFITTTCIIRPQGLAVACSYDHGTSTPGKTLRVAGCTASPRPFLALLHMFQLIRHPIINGHSQSNTHELMMSMQPGMASGSANYFSRQTGQHCL